MGAINQLIHIVHDAGLGQTVYDFSHILNFVVLFAFMLWYRKKYGIKVIEAFVTLAFVYVVGTLLNRVVPWIISGFKEWGANNIVRIFVLIPFLALVPIRLFRVERKKMLDYLAPCIPLCQAIGHLACIFVGCCHGYPSSWGVWNPAYDQIMFPTQPLEAFVALLVTIVVVLYSKRGSYRVTGKAYPLMLILFGSTRFFLEFLRDNEKIFGSISNLALHAAFMSVVGIVWLCYIWEKEARTAKRKVKH